MDLYMRIVCIQIMDDPLVLCSNTWTVHLSPRGGFCLWQTLLQNGHRILVHEPAGTSGTRLFRGICDHKIYHKLVKVCENHMFS
jgi:hypothetical protein